MSGDTMQMFLRTFKDHSRTLRQITQIQMFTKKIIHKYKLFSNFDFICFLYKSKAIYLDTLHKQKKKETRKIMTLIYCSGVHYSAKLQIAKIIKNKLYRASWEFEFSYKLYLVKNVQLSRGTPHLISPEPCKNTGRKCVNIGDIGYDCSEKKIH